jgi:AcrR family transcriptional regulator
MSTSSTPARRRARSPRRQGASTPRRARAPRSDIFDRAAELMTVKGFAGMSARDLADALDFSKASVFYHLGTKEELLYRIFVDTLEDFLRRVEEILGRSDPPEAKLRALIDYYIRQAIDRSAVMTVWFKERGHLTPEHAAHVAKLEARVIATTTRFYEQAIESGVFRPMNPSVARTAMFGMCFHFTRRPELRDQLTMETLSRQLQEIACNGLLARRSPA